MLQDSTGSSCGRVVAPFMSLALIWVPARVQGVTYLPMTTVVRSAQEIAVLLLQGPGQAPAAPSAEEAVSALVYTVFVDYRLDLTTTFFFFFLFALNSVHFMPATGLAGSLLHLEISGFFLAFLRRLWNKLGQDCFGQVFPC